MKKITNFRTNEMLDNNSLSTIKGGGTLGSIIDAITNIINGGDETDKRPKKPTIGGASFGKNVYKA